MKMYLISDNIDTQIGMRLVGIDGCVAHDSETITAEIKKAVNDPEAASAALVFFCTPFELVVRQTLCIVCFAPLSSLAPIYTDRCHSDTALASFTNSVSIAVSLIVMLALGLGFVL